MVLGSRKKDSDSKTEFVFLSVFKWEYREGWDVLLKAYLKEFSRIHGIASICVIDTHIAQVDLPIMYKAAHAFVLPSRGEVWLKHLVEAMSMSLKVITTNWSGPTEYLTEENSYPLPVDRMS